jgi:hypothetical protein
MTELVHEALAQALRALEELREASKLPKPFLMRDRKRCSAYTRNEPFDPYRCENVAGYIREGFLVCGTHFRTVRVCCRTWKSNAEEHPKRDRYESWREKWA